jgi:hypothetical protein
MRVAFAIVVSTVAVGACSRRAQSTAATGGSPTPSPSRTPTSVQPVDQFGDPFAYCAAAGTADEPDARYVGPKQPDAIRTQLATPGMFAWRCDRGNVMACSYGANLPCGKANANRAPTPAEAQFCRENPDSLGIPAAVTGHDTLFVWACRGGSPIIERQMFHTDERGFVAEFWREIRRP